MQALRQGLAFAEPLSVDIEHAQAIRKARRDLAVEEVAPLGFADSMLRMIRRSKAEVELGIDPAACLARVG